MTEHYTVIDGVKYNITDFISNHPGGADMILLASGQDSTAMFHSYHRNIDKPNAILKKLKSEPSDVPSERIKSPMMDDLKGRVNRYFEKNQYSSRGGAMMIGKSLFTFALTCFVYYLVVFKSLFYLAPVLGILYSINGLSIQHDANHGAFSKYLWLNKMAGFVDELIGGSALMWRHQHVIAHHVNPNNCDVDFDTFSNYPLIRYNPALEATWFQKYQHIYAPVLYTLLGIAYPIGDIQSYLSGKYVSLPLHPLRDEDKILFVVGKILHYGLNLVLPIYLHGLTGFFYVYLILQFFGGFFLASVFAVSHNNEVCEFNHSTEGMDWTEIQIRTSANWSVGSIPWLLVSGGLNYQIEHHLFPGINHLHYPALSKITQEYCKDYNLPYNSYPTFTAIFTSHIASLKKLGQK